MEKHLPPKRKVALVCDFFFPRKGGVESHIYYVANDLMRHNHKAIIITHTAGQRKGVRYMGNGVKVYYLPYPETSLGIVYVTFWSMLMDIRHILISEQIDIVHCHACTSIMTIETIMLARLMGRHVIFTDHSLFQFDDLACVMLNGVVKCTFTCVDQSIAVSHILRDNLCLRGRLLPDTINVVPNAIVMS